MTNLEKLNNTKNTLSEGKNKEFKTMADLINSYDFSIDKINTGSVIEGVVIGLTNNEVWVDIEGRCIGIVRGRELYDTTGRKVKLSVGDKVLAYILELEDEEGYMVLSFRRASREKVWWDLSQKRDNQEVITVKICEANKGGLLAKTGELRGFIPTSQLSAENYPRVEGGDRNKIFSHLRKFVGKYMRVKVIDVDQKTNKLILSEKAALVEKRKKIVSSFKIGQVISGKATGIVDFGIFVDLGEIEGLVHISEVSWQKVEDLSDYVKVGEKIKVKVISIDDDKVSLSMKVLTPDPWLKAVTKYKPDQIVQGEITRLTPFGAFAKIDKNIDGLVHISEITQEHISNPSDILKVGDKLDFKILSVQPENHKIELSLKALAEDSESKDEKKQKKLSKLEDIEGITSPILEKLKKAGFNDVSSLKKTFKEDLIKIKGISQKKAEKILSKVKK